MGWRHENSAGRPVLVLPDRSDLVAAGFIAPIGTLFVVVAWQAVDSVARSLASPHLTLFGIFGAVVLSTFLMLLLAVPVAWMVTFAVGMPIMLLWCRVRGGMTGFTAAAIGVAIGGLLFLLSAALTHHPHAQAFYGAALCGACGGATCLVFWWIALRTAA